MDGINLHDMFAAGSTGIALLITVMVVRNDVKWLKDWCKEHKLDDDRRFDELAEDIREYRARHR